MSTFYGLNWTAWRVNGLVGPILLRRAFDATGSYSGVLLTIAGATFVAALLALPLPTIQHRNYVAVAAV